mmetsp:Transcript_27269/g.80302  ORF Transcript_27269/g.80302 Transcript_27269/m.80302 type:complete len:243 (+) Transcript_27269:679-1407(+)
MAATSSIVGDEWREARPASTSRIYTGRIYGTQSTGRIYGGRAHLVGRAARHREALEGAERLQAAPRRLGFGHDDARRSAVRQLRRVAGGDEGGRVHLASHGVHPREGLERGAGPVALVAIREHRLVGRLAGLFVCDEHRRLHRHDFILEEARLLSRGGASLRLDGVNVLRLARDAVPGRDNVCRLNHGHPQGGKLAHQLLLGDGGFACHGRHHRDALHPAADRDVHAVDHHRVRSRRHRLQP